MVGLWKNFRKGNKISKEQIHQGAHLDKIVFDLGIGVFPLKWEQCSREQAVDRKCRWETGKQINCWTVLTNAADSRKQVV